MSSSSSSSSPAIKDFLKTSKQHLHESQKDKSPITLVMGNDEADIDTIAATILFSYFRSSSPPQGAFSKHYVPLIQTGRSSLSQIMHLPSLLKNLHHSGLSLSDLVVLDDMSLDGKQSHLSAENTHLFLINWNLLVGRQGENFSKNIAGVIDRHNKDEDYVPKDTKPEPRIIGGAGSATALAVNAIRESNGEKGWNKELAQLGLAGILVPTKNLKHHATKEDESAYEFLAGLYGKDFDRSGFYHSIVGEERREPEPTPKPVAVPVPVVPVTTREPVVSSGTVNQATPSGIEPIHGTRTATEAAPEDIYSGGSHRTFTANRLDPTGNETIKSFHEENLHKKGNELSGTSGYGSASTVGTTGLTSGLTSGTSTGLGSTTERGVLGTPGYSKGVDSSDKDAFNYGGAGYQSGHSIGQTSNVGGTPTYNESSTGSYGSSGLTGSSTTGTTTGQESEGFLSKVMHAVGLGGQHDEDTNTTSNYGTTSSTSGYGSSGAGDTATSSTRYEGEGVGRTENVSGTSGVAGTSSSAGYGSGYGSGLTGSSTSGLGSSSYDNTSSASGLGSSSYGTSAPASESFNSAGGSTTGTSTRDAAKELTKDVTYGGERGGTGNGAAEDTKVNKDKVMY